MKRSFFVMIFFISNLYTNDHGINLTILSNLGSGFFSDVSLVLDRILYYEHYHLAHINIDWTQPFFPYKNNPDDNGWHLFFEPIEYTPSHSFSTMYDVVATGTSRKHPQIHFNWCSSLWCEPDAYHTYRLKMHDALTKYITIKEHILNEINDFYDTHMKDFVCIGVHVRYCSEHAHEIPGNRIPELEDYYTEIDTLIQKQADQPIKIYVASDSHYVLQQFKLRYGDHIIHIDAFRDDYRGDPHLIDINTQYWLNHPEEFHAKKPGYNGGKEALMECILLSRCNYLINTASNLAAFATHFNPFIDFIFLPRDTEKTECKCAEFILPSK